MRLSLRLQQTALFVLVILAAVVLLSVWVFGELRAGVTETARADQLKDASAVAAVLGPSFPVKPGDTGTLERSVRQFSDILADDVRIYDTAGSLVEERRTLTVPEEVLADARSGGQQRGGWVSIDLSQGGVSVAASPIYDQAGVRAGVAVVSNSLDAQKAMLRTLSTQLTVASIVATLLAGILGLLFSEVIARNTRRLIAAANAIAAGDFSRRMPRQALLPAEIATLVETFNRMAAQLGDAFDTLKGQEAAQRQFVANASHELRTPIAALKGAIEILDEGAKEKPEARDEFLATMRVEANRLQRLVDNLFTLAQVDAGRMRLHLREESANEIVSVVAASLGTIAAEAGVTLALDLPDVPALAMCDRDQVTQVLVALIDNAIKHTPARGTVTLAVQALPSRVRLCVRDTGTGIAPDVLPHIFDRFYTSRKAEKGGRRGSGLGLAIAREIVEAHGTRIEVRSEPGHGSEFCFELGAAESAAEVLTQP